MTEAALIAAIQANPGDDTGRLVYADWLDEHGTTDQHKARSEWIRLVCWTPATRKCKATGRRHRVPGERAWLVDNAPRLWPHLHGLKAKWWKPKTHVELLTGRVRLSIALAAPYHQRARNFNGADVNVPSGETIDHTHVSVLCDRGVTTEVYVTFLRAERVALAAARDEPFAALKFSGLPDRCFIAPSPGFTIGIYKRPFAMRGLEGVWLAAEGEAGREFPGNEAYKVCSDGRAVDKALTKWARREAGSPLLVPGAETVAGGVA
jgi:uncharacterized protein (TIGR02996 family)